MPSRSHRCVSCISIPSCRSVRPKAGFAFQRLAWYACVAVECIIPNPTRNLFSVVCQAMMKHLWLEIVQIEQLFDEAGTIHDDGNHLPIPTGAVCKMLASLGATVEVIGVWWPLPHQTHQPENGPWSWKPPTCCAPWPRYRNPAASVPEVFHVQDAWTSTGQKSGKPAHDPGSSKYEPRAWSLYEHFRSLQEACASTRDL